MRKRFGICLSFTLKGSVETRSVYRRGWFVSLVVCSWGLNHTKIRHQKRCLPRISAIVFIQKPEHLKVLQASGVALVLLL